MSDQEGPRDCYRLMYQGMVEKDEAVLRQVLAPEFTLTHMTGMRQTREEFVRAVLDGTLSYAWAQHQGIVVRDVREAQAELVGQSLVRAAVFGGGYQTWRLQLRCRLVWRDGRWQVADAEASTY